MSTRRTHRAPAGWVAGLTLLAACGGGSGDGSGAGTPTTPAQPSAAGAATEGGFDETACTFLGTPLWGQIYVTDDPSQADVDVWFHPRPEPGDLGVYWVFRSGEATSCGKWELVAEPGLADVIVHVPSDPSQADVLVAEVSHPDEAGPS